VSGPTSHFSSQERATSTHWTQGSMDPRPITGSYLACFIHKMQNDLETLVGRRESITSSLNED
jgi:hypothetical protein